MHCTADFFEEVKNVLQNALNDPVAFGSVDNELESARYIILLLLRYLSANIRIGIVLSCTCVMQASV